MERFDPQIKVFDILLYWKANTLKYPILSKLALDMLVVSISIVFIESVFTTRGKIVDTFRRLLKLLRHFCAFRVS